MTRTLIWYFCITEIYDFVLRIMGLWYLFYCSDVTVHEMGSLKLSSGNL